MNGARGGGRGMKSTALLQLETLKAENPDATRRDGRALLEAYFAKNPREALTKQGKDNLLRAVFGTLREEQRRRVSEGDWAKVRVDDSRAALPLPWAAVQPSEPALVPPRAVAPPAATPREKRPAPGPSCLRKRPRSAGGPSVTFKVGPAEAAPIEFFVAFKAELWHEQADLRNNEVEVKSGNAPDAYWTASSLSRYVVFSNFLAEALGEAVCD